MIYSILQKHIDNLFALEDNFDKYDYIISVGKTSPGFPESKRIKENIMHGCQSIVWLVGEKKDNKYYFIGDSDALIVKGIVVIMTEAFSGYTKEDLNKFDSNIIKRRKYINEGMRKPSLGVFISTFSILSLFIS